MTYFRYQRLNSKDLLKDLSPTFVFEKFNFSRIILKFEARYCQTFSVNLKTRFSSLFYHEETSRNLKPEPVGRGESASLGFPLVLGLTKGFAY